MVSTKLNIPGVVRPRSVSGRLTATLTAAVAAAMVAVTPTQALAIATPVPLGTADAFVVPDHGHGKPDHGEKPGYGDDKPSEHGGYGDRPEHLA
ncbi:hypothetical protein OIE71_03715 [Streptomyces sp. NBC_01725]|uniref:hypothetical protein n=1 Tax=Streptomyces sp. NBC_01725 TaxID=2975923 RepID=UPI002E2DE070|nr:hypothetical protein [Streptomyces sp. NBC_01725]